MSRNDKSGTGNHVSFEELVGGLLKVDPKKIPKPGRKKVAGKKPAKAQAKKKPAK